MSDFLGSVDHEAFEHTRQSEQDAHLFVKFFQKAVRDEKASKENGRACFTEREYIDIRVPGTRGTGASRPATFQDKQRFPKHYAAFKQRVELPTEGTPLSEWAVISRTFAAELAYHEIKTVEQLAELNDNAASQLMGGYGYKAKAKEWLERAAADVTADRLQDELNKRDAKIQELSDKLEQLMADKPKRKRRSKEEIDSDHQRSNTGERSTEPGSS